MAPIPDDRLDEFIRLWKKAFGEDLYRTEARVVASGLLEFYCLIQGPLPTHRRRLAVVP